MTTIEWTDQTNNPIKEAKEVDGKLVNHGNYCIPISPGCKNCYASVLNKNAFFGGNGRKFGVRPEGHPEMWLDISMLEKWQRIRKPRKIFVGSMTDIFGDWVPEWMIFAMIDAMINSMATFQLLTKRPERASQCVAAWLRIAVGASPNPLQLSDNIWIGTSVENQQQLNERSFWLASTPGAVRFLSIEPLLGPIDLFLVDDPLIPDWVIIGGESGPHARPVDCDWILDILSQCRAANVPAFVKQLGSNWAKRSGAKHSKGGDPDEWPSSLGVRMFPGEVWE